MWINTKRFRQMEDNIEINAESLDMLNERVYELEALFDVHKEAFVVPTKTDTTQYTTGTLTQITPEHSEIKKTYILKESALPESTKELREDVDQCMRVSNLQSTVSINNHIRVGDLEDVADDLLRSVWDLEEESAEFPWDNDDDEDMSLSWQSGYDKGDSDGYKRRLKEEVKAKKKTK